MVSSLKDFPFLRNDTRLIKHNETLYKVKVRYQGPDVSPDDVDLTETEAHSQLEGVIRAVIYMSQRNDELKPILTTYFVVYPAMVPWKLAKKLEFSQHGKILHTHPCMLVLSVRVRGDVLNPVTAGRLVGRATVEEVRGKDPENTSDCVVTSYRQASDITDEGSGRRFYRDEAGTLHWVVAAESSSRSSGREASVKRRRPKDEGDTAAQSPPQKNRRQKDEGDTAAQSPPQKNRRREQESLVLPAGATHKLQKHKLKSPLGVRKRSVRVARLASNLKTDTEGSSVTSDQGSQTNSVSGRKTLRPRSARQAQNSARPAKRNASAAKRSASPAKTKRNASPAKRNASPAKRNASPTKRKASPAKRNASPAKRKASPAKRKRNASPAKWKRNASPAKRNASPAKRNASPAKRNASSDKRSTSPAKRNASLAKGNASPTKRKASPAKRNASPAKRKRNTSPAKRNGSPANRQPDVSITREKNQNSKKQFKLYTNRSSPQILGTGNKNMSTRNKPEERRQSPRSGPVSGNKNMSARNRTEERRQSVRTGLVDEMSSPQISFVKPLKRDRLDGSVRVARDPPTAASSTVPAGAVATTVTRSQARRSAENVLELDDEWRRMERLRSGRPAEESREGILQRQDRYVVEEAERAETDKLLQLFQPTEQSSPSNIMRKRRSSIQILLDKLVSPVKQLFPSNYKR